MTYTPTNRPVPSDAPEDLYFNSSTLDKLVTGPAGVPVVDRAGIPRKSWATIEQQGAGLNAFLGPQASEPTTRDDGTALQLGDRYFNTTDGLEYLYKATGWEPNNLDGQLIAGDTGWDQVGAKETGSSNSETVGEKLRRQPIYLESFFPGNVIYVEAPYGLAEVLAATAVDDAFDAAMAAAIAQGRKLELRGKVYKLTRRSPWASELNIEGVACGQWIPTANPSIAGGVYNPDMGGTVLLFCGDAVKDQTSLGVTDCRMGGGVVANDNIHEAGFDDAYSLSNFYNDDANLTTGAAATPKLFSVAVDLGRGVQGVQAKNFRIMKSFKGIEGYLSAEIGYGDDWDIGLRIDNATNNYFENVQVVGYWNIAGRYARVGVVGSEGSATSASIERNVFDRCEFQGMVGEEIRGIDSHRILGVGADFIDLPLAANHPFDVTTLAGFIRTTSNTSHTFTGVSVVGGNLRLTGVSPTPVGLPLTASVIPALMANGMALWEDRNCIITSMDHQSGNRVTAAAMGAFRKNRPSTAHMMSGYTLRGYSAPGTKLILQDDVAIHNHWVIDTIHGPKFEIESKDANGLGLGARVISSPAESANTRVANPSGSSFRLEIDTLRNSNDVDYRPIGTLAPPRFPLGSGFLLANTCQIKAVHDAIDNGRFIRPGVGQSAGVKRSDGGLAVYFDDASQQVRMAKDVRLDTNFLLNSSGTQKFNITGSSASVNSDPFIVNTADGLTVSYRLGASELRAGSNNNKSLGSVSVQWSDVFSVKGTFSGPVRPGQYTLATLPSAAAFNGYEIDVTDATGGPKRCRSNGSVWQILNTTTTVS